MKCSLSFVELHVRDWPKSVAWYRDVLGLELLLRRDADQFALFAAGAARLALKAGAPDRGKRCLFLRWMSCRTGFCDYKNVE